MQSHPISQLILLFCAFAAAASTPCLIQAGPGINFDKDTNVLTCSTEGDALRGIELASRLYDSLKCDEVEGWKSKKIVWKKTLGKDEWEVNVVADASTPLVVNCVEYCTSTGDGIKVKIDQNEGIDRQATIKITCADPSLGLYHLGRLMTKRRAHCSFTGKWKSAGWDYDTPLSSYLGTKISNEIWSPQQFECKKVPVCSVNFQEEAQFNIASKTLTCIFQSNVIWTISDDGQALSHKSLKCDEVNGWSNGMGADTQLDIFCSTPSCTIQGMKLEDSKRMECSSGNQSFGAVKVNSEMFTHIDCDGIFWKNEFNENIAWALTPLPASCVQYCEATGNGTKIERIDNKVEAGVLVTCLDPALELFHDREVMRHGKAWCKGEYGWKSSGFNITNDILSNERFECKKAQCSFQPAEGLHFNDFTKKLTCSGGNNSFGAVEFKSEKYWEIICDGKYWMGYDKDLALAHIPLPATCVQYCEATGNGTKIEKFDKDDKVLVTCDDPELGLYHDRGLMRNGEATCKGSVEGWNSGSWHYSDTSLKSAKISSDIYSTERFECRKASRCSFIFDEKAQFDNSTNTLSCLDESDVIWTNINSEKRSYVSLKCDDVNGWSNGVNIIAEATIPLNYICSKPCSFYQAQWVQFDDSTKTLSCNSGENELRAIRVGSKLHTSLTCDEVKGWMDGVEIIAKADTQISPLCDSYCEVSSGVQVTTDGLDSLTAFCSDSSEKLFFNYDTPVTRATCRLEGWSIETETEREQKKLSSEYSPDLRCRHDYSPDSDNSTPDSSAWSDSSDETSIAWTNPWVIAGLVGGIIIIVLIIVVVAKVCCRKEYVDYNTDWEPQTEQTDNSDTVDKVVVETPSDQ